MKLDLTPEEARLLCLALESQLCMIETGTNHLRAHHVMAIGEDRARSLMALNRLLTSEEAATAVAMDALLEKLKGIPVGLFEQHTLESGHDVSTFQGPDWSAKED